MERELRIELGRLWLTAADARRLGEGSRLELDGGASAAATAWLGGRRVATGEVVVMDGRLCLRVDRISAAGAAAPAAARRADGAE